MNVVRADEEVVKSSPVPSSQAKKYNRTKLTLSLIGTALSFFLAVFILASGVSVWLEKLAYACTSFPYLALLLFTLFFALINGLFSSPLRFYSGFILEHRYNLSNQTFLQWLWEQTKAALVSIPIAVPLILLFYFFLRTYQELWWLPVAIALFIVSIVLSKIAPVLIMPLFYKFSPLENDALKDRILHLCADTRMNVTGIFTFNLSKTTKKANAGFTGIGKSKRIILGDTLMEHFSNEEIETVFAHELGHYVHGHIWKNIVVGTCGIFLGLFITSRLYAVSLSWFGFSSVDQLAALPLLALWLGVYSLVTSPLSNMLSRRYEFEADRYAIDKTGNPPAFRSTMKKLAEMNLADTAPHPLVEFLFYSHPSIEKRIHAAEKA
ncbi:MAG TPA: M48 family metallopeptidase [Bacteroidota bacterium]|nr:M48 family metallopeptidase [Bacteroidota bacterium]